MGSPSRKTLFIDGDGDIFHTIRRQGDYHKNIFEGELAITTLARQLTNHPDETFVDYEYYSVSDEPSAFFVEPVLKDGCLEGWFVLQCAINKINNMFTQEKGLGATGEVFLVNRHQYMLTESRFSKETSILNRHLSSENIETKFRERSGRKMVTDYRGVRAFTSFEVCHIGASEWLLIANHPDSIENITDRLVEQGLLLSQIKIIYADSEYGNVIHDYHNNQTMVEWHSDKEKGKKLRQCASSVAPVGETVKSLIGYE
ncbi:MAG: hypothetical protein GY846_06700 [Deltaproteobacteria bacterium]|nr:hypothetical protein [Deltaproteobacteria bacterium]